MRTVCAWNVDNFGFFENAKTAQRLSTVSTQVSALGSWQGYYNPRLVLGRSRAIP